MENLITRHMHLTVLVGVLFLQVLGLAVQVKRTTDTQSTRLIRVWTVGAITPLERVIVGTQQGVRRIWNNYLYLRGVREENRELKQEIERLRLEQVRLSEGANQAHRLQDLLGFREQYISQTVVAQVIGSSGSEQSRLIYIDKGENANLKTDMPVITADGVVGKVLAVYPSQAQVLLINDQTSGLGAILEKSRLQGVVKGSSVGETVLDKVMSDEPVQPGDRVLTSGGDGIFPKGLPVGTVSRVTRDLGNLFWRVTLKPAANLNRLEEVLVVTQKQEREPIAAEAVGATRAADILASRLPSVPVKAAGEGPTAPNSVVKPDAARPDTAKPDPAKPDPAKPEQAKPTQVTPSGTNPSEPRQEAKPQ